MVMLCFMEPEVSSSIYSQQRWQCMYKYNSEVRSHSHCCHLKAISIIYSEYVLAKVRERLAVGKQAAQRFDRQRFNLSKLN